jgi:ubiquinone/menaquinone biosynthesis C-methylase UbiE
VSGGETGLLDRAVANALQRAKRSEADNPSQIQFLKKLSLNCYSILTMNTDRAWQKWGENDPYFGVYTNEKYRIENLTPVVKNEFFSSGEKYVQQIFSTIKKRIDPNFQPTTALDFGCGTGRILLTLAKICTKVVGVDISDGMLAEAKNNLSAFDNVKLYKSDDQLSKLEEDQFDLVNTYIVLQHIPQKRVLAIFKKLVSLVAKQGVGVIHLTFAKTKFDKNQGIAPNTLSYYLKTKLVEFKKKLFNSSNEPEMQMNLHSLNQTIFILQQAGIDQFYAETTNHDGAIGVILYFKK